MKSFGLKACAVCASFMLAACTNTSNDNASNNPSLDNPSPDGPSVEAPSAVVLTDPQGDVESVGRRAEDFQGATPAPQQKHGDIVTSSAEHTATKVLVRIGLAHLAVPRRWDTYIAQASFKTNASKGQSWVALSFGTWRGLGMERLTQSGHLETVRCPSLDHTIDYDHDEITLSIPRTCLKEPDWVRVGVFFQITLDAGAITTLDDGLRDGYRPHSKDAFSARIPKP